MKKLLALEQVGDALFDHPIKRDMTIEFFQDLRHHLVLAFHKAEAIGMATGFHYVHPDKDPSMFINEVGVTLEFQNQGVGRELVKYFWKYAQKIGCQGACGYREIKYSSSKVLLFRELGIQGRSFYNI